MHLNIWRPSVSNKCSKRYPVLIYFYGGVGSIFMLEHHKQESIAYDGAPLAALGQLILVTVNYRSGPFGRYDSYDNSEEN